MGTSISNCGDGTTGTERIIFLKLQPLSQRSQSAALPPIFDFIKPFYYCRFFKSISVLDTRQFVAVMPFESAQSFARAPQHRY